MSSSADRVFGQKPKEPGAPASELIDAATVIVLTDGDEGLETLMLRKNKGQAFGGMWVFPGGRVEDDDDGPAGAAVREASEETGLVLDEARLVPYTRWTPPEGAPKRFDTHFFLVGLPPGADEVVVDGGEIGEHVWTTPGAALDRHAAGEIELAPPTWVTLHRLSQYADLAGAIADAESSPFDHFQTRARMHDGRLMMLWAGDVAYDGGDIDAEGARHRLDTVDGGWIYERSG